jgi:hypothetical protein
VRESYLAGGGLIIVLKIEAMRLRAETTLSLMRHVVCVCVFSECKQITKQHAVLVVFLLHLLID